MAQDSAFWDDGVGDALSADIWDSPYESEEFSDFYSKLIACDKAKAYVIPDCLSDLAVSQTTTASMRVHVLSGAVFLRGRIYEITSLENITLTDADGANPRLDRIVAEISFAAQTIEVTVITGVAAAVPALPALTQDAVTYQIDLAHVWVAAAVTSITDAEISDQREFAPWGAHSTNTLTNDNMIRNSEFMFPLSISGGFGVGSYENYPWTAVAAGRGTIAYTAKPDQMSRGQSIQITADGANRGIYQTFTIKGSTTYAIRFLYYVTAGDVGKVQIYTNGTGFETKQRNLRRTGSWLVDTVYYTSVSDATTMTIELLAANNTDIIRYGQVLVLEGYVPGPFRPFHEELCGNLSGDNAWGGDGFTDNKNIGVHTIDLSVDFGGVFPDGIKAVYLVYRCAAGALAATIAMSGADATPTYLSAVDNERVQVINTPHHRCVSLGIYDRTFYVTVATNNTNLWYLFIGGVYT